MSTRVLPTTLSLGVVDVSAITGAIEELQNRLTASERRTHELELIVAQQSNDMSTLFQKSSTTQDQFINLYEAVQDTSSKVAMLQENSYEKRQALSERIRVNSLFDKVDAQLAHLEKTKVDLGSVDLANHVQQLASAASSAALHKFEREQKHWTLEQTKASEERLLKHVSTREEEGNQVLERRFQYSTQKIDEVSHREQVLRKEVDAQLASTSSALIAVCSKLHVHEKHIVDVEERGYSRVDWIRERFDTFLELCFGTCWEELALRLPDSHPLLRGGSRKYLFSPLSEMIGEERTARNKRFKENVADWRRLGTISSRNVSTLPGLLQTLEISDEQLDRLLQDECRTIKLAHQKSEDQVRQDSAANEATLSRYLTQGEAKSSDEEPTPSSLPLLKYFSDTPLFCYLRKTIVANSEHLVHESTQQFHDTFSQELSQLSKELRGKSNSSGLDEVIKNVATREVESRTAILESRIAEVTSNIIPKSDLEDLLRMKADITIADRKADEGYVRFLEVELRAAIEQESKKMSINFQETTMSKITELTQSVVFRHDPRIKNLLSVADDVTGLVMQMKGLTKPLVTSTPSTSGTTVCLTCQHPVSAQRPSSANPSEGEKQRNHEPVSLDKQSLLTSTINSSSARKPFSAAETTVGSAFRLKDWADDVERKAAERKAPRPPQK